MIDQSTKPEAPKLQDYTLKFDGHEHNGKPCKKGDVIQLYPKQIAFIEKVAKDKAMADAKAAPVVVQ